MNKLLGSLLRDGLAVAAGNQIRKSIRRMGGSWRITPWVAVFALAALAFLYVLIYDWLAQRLDPLSAAGILFAGNLLVAIVMIVARRLSKPRPALNVQVPVVNGAVPDRRWRRAWRWAAKCGSGFGARLLRSSQARRFWGSSSACGLS